MEGAQVKLDLKIMVDTKAKKVVFAEAGKDFVDFLFNILSLPLSTVVKLLNNVDMPGCLQDLYKSVESLKTDYFEPSVNKDVVLLPKLPIVLPLLSLNQVPATLTCFKCPLHNYVSNHKGVRCPGCCSMSKVTYIYVAPESGNELPGIVKGAVAYMVMDNLEVKPMSITLIKSLISDFDFVTEQEVKFGLKEGLTLLKASMETKDVLTAVFLGTNKKVRTQV